MSKIHLPCHLNEPLVSLVLSSHKCQFNVVSRKEKQSHLITFTKTENDNEYVSTWYCELLSSDKMKSQTLIFTLVGMWHMHSFFHFVLHCSSLCKQGLEREAEQIQCLCSVAFSLLFFSFMDEYVFLHCVNSRELFSVYVRVNRMPGWMWVKKKKEKGIKKKKKKTSQSTKSILKPQGVKTCKLSSRCYWGREKSCQFAFQLRKWTSRRKNKRKRRPVDACCPCSLSRSRFVHLFVSLRLMISWQLKVWIAKCRWTSIEEGEKKERRRNKKLKSTAKRTTRRERERKTLQGGHFEAFVCLSITGNEMYRDMWKWKQFEFKMSPLVSLFSSSSLSVCFSLFLFILVSFSSQIRQCNDRSLCPALFSNDSEKRERAAQSDTSC